MAAELIDMYGTLRRDASRPTLDSGFGAQPLQGGLVPFLGRHVSVDTTVGWWTDTVEGELTLDFASPIVVTEGGESEILGLVDEGTEVHVQVRVASSRARKVVPLLEGWVGPNGDGRSRLSLCTCYDHPSALKVGRRITLLVRHWASGLWNGFDLDFMRDEVDARVVADIRREAIDLPPTLGRAIARAAGTEYEDTLGECAILTDYHVWP